MSARKPARATRTRTPPAELRLAEDIAALEQLAMQATEGERPDFRAAVTAREKVARLRQELERRRAVRLANALRDPCEQLAALRQIAERDGSWVAASKYGAAEADLRARLEAERTRQEEAALEHLTEDQLQEMIADAFSEMAPDLRRVILEDLAERYLDGDDSEGP